jgi:hypothetical protein
MIDPMNREVTAGGLETFERLEHRLRTLLPAEYQDTYQDVQPVSMRSAGLKYDADGAVAWDQIWGSFCDLAMAGGPPHKGALLEPGAEADIDAAFGRYDAVVEEICRGIRLATGLRAYPSPEPGWVSVTCTGDTMAEWLLRAITMENVAARRAGAVLELPAAPHFRLEKEIKNVVTVIAKTAHYWLGHVPAAQRQEIGDLFMRMTVESPLLEPTAVGSVEDDRTRRAVIAARMAHVTGWRAAEREYPGWLGVECPDVKPAIWMMRALVASNVLARRETRTLFVPLDAARDPGGVLVAAAVAQAFEYVSARGVC